MQNSMKFKVSRIVTQDLNKANYAQGLKAFLQKNPTFKTEYLMTQGGFIDFKFSNFQDYPLSKFNGLIPIDIYKEAENHLNLFLANLGLNIFDYCEILTIGIDGKNDVGTTIELVAIVRNNMPIIWTGKSYPTSGEINHLMRIDNLDSHFVTINGERVAILGCHDLNIYSSRGRSKLINGSTKNQINQQYRKELEQFNPKIVLQHPHTTHHPLIWRNSWNNLLKANSAVTTYASGICYFDSKKSIKPSRNKLNSVLSLTKSIDCCDIII